MRGTAERRVRTTYPACHRFGEAAQPADGIVLRTRGVVPAQPGNHGVVCEDAKHLRDEERRRMMGRWAFGTKHGLAAGIAAVLFSLGLVAPRNVAARHTCPVNQTLVRVDSK